MWFWFPDDRKNMLFDDFCIFLWCAKNVLPQFVIFWNVSALKWPQKLYDGAKILYFFFFWIIWEIFS